MPWKLSEDGKHAWLVGDGGKSFVGLHVDEIGSWIDLRSKEATSFPEFAVYVPKAGGNAKLQLLNDNGDVLTLDLLAVAKYLKSVMPA